MLDGERATVVLQRQCLLRVSSLGQRWRTRGPEACPWTRWIRGWNRMPRR